MVLMLKEINTYIYSYCIVELSKRVKQNDQQSHICYVLHYVCVLNVHYALACFHTAEFDKLRCHFWGTDV